MTLDEAIAHEREFAERYSNFALVYQSNGNFPKADDCRLCADKHELLAKWLEELKSYRVSIFSGDMTQAMLKEEYCKAIDDFSNLLRETRDNRTLRVNCDDLEIRHMAERLKDGGEE